MRQVWITKTGAPEVLQVREAPDPSAGASEVRIRVKAAGVNFADLMARVGLYPDAPKVPCVVGYEVSGVVDQVGAGVSQLAVGDRVFGMPHFGGYTDTLVIPAEQVFRMPEKMSFEEAAALPVVYLTAHHMMLWTGALRDGMRIFIHSAAGGVGLAAIELAQTKKTILFGTASRGKHDFLRQKGVHHPIDSSVDWAPAVREILARDKAEGLDLILDPVGGESWGKGYDLLGPAGRIVAFGLSAAASGKERNLLHALLQIIKVRKYSPMKLMDANKTVSGCNMGHLFGRLDLLIPQFQALIALYEDGKIHPRVDKTFSFDDAAAAHHYIHDRKAMGKVLLVP
jgi:NADPH:quinone reductase-like Zn-dependent oxidoreductase